MIITQVVMINRTICSPPKLAYFHHFEEVHGVNIHATLMNKSLLHFCVTLFKFTQLHAIDSNPSMECFRHTSSPDTYRTGPGPSVSVPCAMRPATWPNKNVNIHIEKTKIMYRRKIEFKKSNQQFVKQREKESTCKRRVLFPTPGSPPTRINEPEKGSIIKITIMDTLTVRITCR